jgi:hypothetical protein
VATKSESLFDVLQRIPAARVQRIEIVDGATLGIPRLSGQVANVITAGARSAGASNGAAWRGRITPRPAYAGGEVSVRRLDLDARMEPSRRPTTSARRRGRQPGDDDHRRRRQRHRDYPTC